MPLASYPVNITIKASDGSTNFPGVNVTLRNTTTKESQSLISNSSGAANFDLDNFIFGYTNGDSLQVQARLGSFYQITTGTVDTGTGSTTFTLTLAAMNPGNIYLVDYLVIKEELVKFIRRMIPDPSSRVSTYTDTFTATANQIKFTLSKSTAKTVLTVLQNSVSLAEYTQYYVDYQDKNSLNNPILYLLTPASVSDSIEVKYTYADSDWVYPDYPRVDLKIDDYPRVMVDFLSATTTEFSLGASDNISEFVVSIIIWSKEMAQLFDLANQIRQLIMQNKKNFFFFYLIKPLNLSPPIASSDRAEKVIQVTQDFSIPLRVEAIV